MFSGWSCFIFPYVYLFCLFLLLLSIFTYITTYYHFINVFLCSLNLAKSIFNLSYSKLYYWWGTYFKYASTLFSSSKYIIGWTVGGSVGELVDVAVWQHFNESNYASAKEDVSTVSDKHFRPMGKDWVNIWWNEFSLEDPLDFLCLQLLAFVV